MLTKMFEMALLLKNTVKNEIIKRFRQNKEVKVRTWGFDVFRFMYKVPNFSLKRGS